MATTPGAGFGQPLGVPVDAAVFDPAGELTHDALQVIAEGIIALAGFGVAAISVVRDAENMQVMAVAGDDEAREVLLGTYTPIERLTQELENAEDWGLFRFLPAEKLDPDEESWGWVPEMTTLDVEDAWDPLDLLVAPLYGEDGRLFGSLSIDVPVDGMRPGPAQRDILNRYAAQAGRALELALERESLVEAVRLANAAREVVRGATSVLELSTLLKQIQPTVVTGFRALGMWIHTFDEDGGQGAVYAGDVDHLELPPNLVKLAERAATEAWRRQQVGIVSRTRVQASELSPGEVDQILEFLEQIGVGSILFVPMGAGTEAVGSLVLTRAAGDPDWSDTETEVALEVGRDLGRAVLNARTFERERHLVHELQAVDLYKNQLIATLSHELKSPLTAILANLELLTDSLPLASEPTGRLAAVERGAGRLVSVVDNLLLLAKVGDPDTPMTKRRVDLVPIVEEVHKLNAAAAEQRGVLLIVADCDGSALVEGDPAELHLVVTNLLSNALKYTPEGRTVTLALTCTEDEVVIACSDEGIGISAEDQARLFQEFFRSDSPAVRAESGTGLGLAIVDRIVTRHGGRIEVTSELGVGSDFRVFLPST